MRSHERSWALISTHLCSWALTSTHKYCAMAPWALMSADEFQWPHGAILMTTLELSWVLIVLIAPWHQAKECPCWSWVLIGIQEHSLFLLAAYECSWVLMGANGDSRVLMMAHEHSWAAMNTPELGAMEQWAWDQGRSSALIALMSTHGTIAP